MSEIEAIFAGLTGGPDLPKKRLAKNNMVPFTFANKNAN